MAEKFDPRQAVTDKIVKAIESGAAKAGTWRMPWHRSAANGAAGGSDIPVNVAGYSYRGGNIVNLWCEQQSRGFTSNLWGTYKQWQDRGAQVRRGEKSSITIFNKKLTVAAKGGETESDGGEESEESTGGRKSIWLARAAFVFNVDQVDGYAPKARKPDTRPEPERFDAAETFFANTGAVLAYGGDRAFYSPGFDRIQLPPRGAFNSAAGYYSTLLHETGHWTGHEKRLARKFGRIFGSEDYAAEELVAELTAAFLCAKLGIENEPRADHAQYVASWLKVLKGDKRAIFTAAAMASKAVDYLHALQPEHAEKIAA